MGTYLNPGNSGFAEVLSEKYVDKTGLIEVINSTISTRRKLTCISRPRRFGKSYAAQMLCAYYDRTVDSHGLFQKWKISKAADYEKYLNQYDVIYIDMTNVMGKTKQEEFVPFLVDAITKELLTVYPATRMGNALDETLLRVVEQTGKRFIMIIDEWDAPIREFNDAAVNEYLLFLRMMFKSSSTTARNFAAVYMTGILPIKKLMTQSALSDFKEYTMLRPGPFAEFVGFILFSIRIIDKLRKIWYNGMGDEK